MQEDNRVPQIPQPPAQDSSAQGQPYASAAYAGAAQGGAYGQQGYAAQGQPASSAAQPIIVNIPAQKKSSLPWIVLLVLVCGLIAGFAFMAVSCSRIMGSSSSLISSSSSSPVTTRSTVAVIHMDGTIEGSGSSYITPETVRDELQNAEDDSNVKAIVLRINSGGGSAAASQEIATYVKDCSKPVVVSVSDVCASGAYMAASQADYIVALPASTVGSIGCIMQISNYTGLMNMLGISVDNITSGDAKDAGSPYRTLTDEERQVFQDQVDQINQEFIDTVTDGRGMDRSAVEDLADGSTFTGTTAVDNGLIDETGTYSDALAKAAELAGIGDDYDTVSFDITSSSLSSSLLDFLSSPTDGADADQPSGAISATVVE